MKKEDTHYMKIALELAKRRKGLTHPNPTVGAILVKNGKIIGEGVHLKAGHPHAERKAIKDAISKGYDITNSTMYVTLEPCCHYGKTPPCTEAIIDNRIKRVVIATLDPNPLVAGKGVEILKKAGIQTEVGILEEEAKKLNEDFFIYIREKRPFINIKLAQTLDGKIATNSGSSKWITSEKSRVYAHQLRKEATAVLIGVNTALKDNPELTVRYVETERQPIRILIDRELKTPLNYKIFNDKAKTIVIVSDFADESKLKQLEKLENIEVIKLPVYNCKFDIKEILNELYKREIMHILVEGGKNTVTRFIKDNLFDKISMFIAPKLIGEDGISSVGVLNVNNIDEAKELKINSIKQIDTDIFLEIYKKGGTNGNS
jgi:diaminohydroxyphosphoribosylaminopyrimidine deaminase/5-amino-6-(5-phosphoribosylamino)uracil reductase